MPEGDKFNILRPAKTILIAPLDWGLGHATRCIPIIRELQKSGCAVIIAAEKSGLSLLKKEFPNLVFISLQGYRIHYSKTGNSFAFKLFTQLPKMLSAVFKEHLWLKKVVKMHSIDAVISDNRLGLYSRNVPCIYITHQLLIKTGNSNTERLAQQIHQWFITKYAACWVPDFEGGVNLAGALSHPGKPPSNIKYMGALSRFENENVAAKDQLIVLLSGPEPQRTILEKKLLAQLTDFKMNVLIIRGLPGNEEQIVIDNQHVKAVNHLSSNELNKAIGESKLVICRSGYTTVMDLIQLKKKAILIPTPGQTEQQYLAKYCQQQRLFFSAAQDDFNLENALVSEALFNYADVDFDMSLYKKIVQQFVKSL